MSSTWARAEFHARAAARAGAAALGSPRVSVALVALAALCVAGQIAWSRLGDPGAASRFATSPACFAIGFLLLLDGAVAMARPLRRLFARKPADGALAALDTFFLRAAQVAAAAALLASLLARTAFEVRVAEGEEYSGDAGQVVAVDPARWLWRAPRGLRFAVERVDDGSAARPGSRPAVVIRTGGGERARASPRRPLWLGAGEYLAPVEAGWALRYDVRAQGRAGAVESAVVKVQLLPPGAVDSFRLAAVPYRVFVALAEEQPPSPHGPALRVAMYRWKLAVAEGALAPGAPLSFEGLEIRFPESRRWATLRVVSDPGLPLAAVATLLALAGLGLHAWRRALGRGAS